MKIELKRIEFSERMSQETNCFVADLWIDGKKIAHCENDGWGGETNYNVYDRKDLPKLKEAEGYCKSLPKIKYGDSEWDNNLTWVIDDLLTKHLESKAYTKALVYKTAKGVSMQITWKGHTITKLLKSASGINAIRQAVVRLKKEGCTIQNTNLGTLVD